MADDIADFPIVVLEADFPEKVGKTGLFDLLMPVGNSGVVFTANVPGVLRTYGCEFTPQVEHLSRLRAAAVLVQMGLIRGEAFEFFRLALGETSAQTALRYGVTEPIVLGWEQNVTEIPFEVWRDMTVLVSKAAQVAFPHQPIQSQDWRPRLIRVFPILPLQHSQENTASYPTLLDNSGIPGIECYPGT